MPSPFIFYRNYTPTDDIYEENVGAMIFPDPYWDPQSGYGFKEWNVARDGSGISRQPGNGTDTGGQTWYAIWEAVSQNIEYITTSSDLTSVANAIRAKAGISVTLEFPSEFITAIASISTGIVPSGTKEITISSAGVVTQDVTDYASVSITTPTGSTIAPVSITGTEATMSVNTNTLTLEKTLSVTPTVSSGYISAGTSSNTTISLSTSIVTKAADTIVPSTTDQTIASNIYLTGTQTISGDSNLVASNILNGVSIFGVTGNVTLPSITQNSTTKILSIF